MSSAVTDPGCHTPRRAGARDEAKGDCRERIASHGVSAKVVGALWGETWVESSRRARLIHHTGTTIG